MSLKPIRVQDVFEKIFQEYRVSNSLDPDQVRHVARLWITTKAFFAHMGTKTDVIFIKDEKYPTKTSM